MNSEFRIKYSINPSSGRTHYSESTEKMDRTTVGMLGKAISKIERGNFGNCAPLKNNFGNCDSMYEAKVDYRNGYRIYFRKNQHDRTVMIASAGTKKRQRHDVIVARSQLQSQKW